MPHQLLQPNLRKRRMLIKRALLTRELTVAEMARKIGRSRTAVSLAINRGCYSGTLRLILEELGL